MHFWCDFLKQNEHWIALELALTRLEHKLHKLRFGELDMVVLYKENKVNNIYKLLIDIYSAWS